MRGAGIVQFSKTKFCDNFLLNVVFIVLARDGFQLNITENIVYKKKQPVSRVFERVYPDHLQGIPALNMSPLKNFTAFHLNNLVSKPSLESALFFYPSAHILIPPLKFPST